ncbi:hypothetical protein ABPG72_019713 [Tetrahymena utriculariae]
MNQRKSISAQNTYTALEVLKKIQKNAVQEDVECKFLCNSQQIYDQIQKILDDLERKTTPYYNDSSNSLDEESDDGEESDIISTEANEEEDDDYSDEQMLLLQKVDLTSRINEHESSLNESLIFIPCKYQEKIQSNTIEIDVKSYHDALVLNSYFINHEDKRFEILKPNQKTEQEHKL